MDTLSALVAVIVAVLIVVVALRSIVRVVTVHDYERGLRYRNGTFRGLVSAGVYPVLRPLSDVRILDSRPAWEVLEGQEVPTADGVVVRVSLACRYVIGDPVAAFTGDQNHQRALYLALQLALRDALATRTLEDALRARSAIGAEVADRCALELARVGIELLAVHIRDIVVPGELRRAFAGVIAARKDGEAALERARGETAALRHLANAGRLVEQSPGLLNLRIVQQLGQTSGNTVVVTLPSERDGAANGRDVAPPGADPATLVARRRGRPTSPADAGPTGGPPMRGPGDGDSG